MAVASKQLPAKESALFRSIVKCYEIKQYKKGLKAADAILKKHPEHGETLAMKGLTLNCMGRKEEAYDFVKSGLRHDLRSHVCWHVFGHQVLPNAIRIDPENLQILRDLYLLQVQMRDLKGFAETRRTMLTLKPNNRNNWIGFAIAHHLVGNYQMAIDIIEKYFSTLDGERVPNYEDSEIYLYQNQLIEESGDAEKALAHLEENKSQITDTFAWRQKKGQFLLQLERYDEAREIFEQLLEINFDNEEFHRGEQCAILKRKDLIVAKSTQKKKAPLPSEVIDFSKEKNGAELEKALVDFYAEKKTTIGANSLISLRFPLDFTRGAEFKTYADVYLKRQLNKNVPSLGSDLKPLYADKDKVLLWTNYLAAQHYDRLGNHSKAIEYIEKCIKQEPSLLDFFQRKARILKHMGDLNKAADVMATEYLLHADRVDEADATIALFTRHEGDPQQNLYDMQCMWYEIECGKSQLRQKKFGLALKRFFAVEKHFNDFVEDQFDFHTYCIRKMTLRAYIQMLRLCDEIYGRPFFVEAAHGAIACYEALEEKEAEKAKEEAKIAAANANMSAAEKKKAKRALAKARKAEFKRKEEEELNAKLHKEVEDKEREATKNGKAKANPGPTRPKDDDPVGEKLAAKPALEEAWRFVSILQRYASEDVKTHLAAFDIALRKKKFLLCLQALLKAQKLENVSVGTKKELSSRRVVFLEEVKQVTNPVVLKGEALPASVKLYVVAGEASGDAIGAKVIRALQRQQPPPSLEFRGIGGPLMCKAGKFESLFPMQELSVMGLLEVVPHIWRFQRRIQDTLRDIETYQPDLILTVDSKGFTFRVLKALQASEQRTRGKRIKKAHYVAPSVWAYKHRGKRDFTELKQLLDAMFTILPFEEDIFRAGEETQSLQNNDRSWCHFVGHPAVEDFLEANGVYESGGSISSDRTLDSEVGTGVDALLDFSKYDRNNLLVRGRLLQTLARSGHELSARARVRDKFGIPSDAFVICALVGSRANEVKKSSQLVLEAIEKFKRKNSPEQQEVNLRRVPTISAVEKQVKAHISAADPGVKCRVLPDLDTEERLRLFQSSDAAVAVSGTIVLETVLANLPTVVIYRANRLTEWIAKRLAAPTTSIAWNDIPKGHFAMFYETDTCRTGGKYFYISDVADVVGTHTFDSPQAIQSIMFGKPFDYVLDVMSTALEPNKQFFHNIIIAN
ncbi:N-terminal acetyltransferase A, auxiliary subunit [Phytophthora cactorum]|nr:N-terminal acetyltransferase A, auxiliary subunit [Phytophthora cactorum]